MLKRAPRGAPGRLAGRFLPYLVPRSLPARVLWLTVGIILLVEMVILMPSLGRQREAFLWDRITDAHLAAFSAGHDGGGDAAALLRLAGCESIRLVRPDGVMVLSAGPAVKPDFFINLDREDLAVSMGRADLEFFGFGGRHIWLTATSPLETSMQVQVVISGAVLDAYLRTYVWHIAALSVVIALVTGILVFLALNRLLVRPMRMMTASIVGFRQDPAAAGTDLSWLSGRRDDEISEAARELAVMQDELRAALWRNARLAALGISVAKISHDLRNILTSALLVADRLQEAADPVMKQAADTLIGAVERAAELVSRTVDFAREGPPAITRGPVALRELVEEVGNVVRPLEAGVVVANHVPGSVVLALDRAQIYRVLVNLFRNAVEAGARRIEVTVEGENGGTRLVVADDGPGLPAKVQANLFRPFTGSGRRGGTGLGLAIARDLVRAHGGDLLLRSTGAGGTVFVMGLASVDLVVG
jgi:signal transduction histidine kinase